MCVFVWKYSKPAMLEGLEVDQYIWGVIQSLANAPYSEVTIDTLANWKPVPPLGVTNNQQDTGLFIVTVTKTRTSNITP